MIKKIFILYLGMVLSISVLNACEQNRSVGIDWSQECFSSIDQTLLKNIRENAVLDYLRAERGDALVTDWSRECFASVDQRLLKNIRENAVLEYLNGLRVQQKIKADGKNSRLKVLAVGGALTVGAAGLGVVAYVGYVLRNLVLPINV